MSHQTPSSHARPRRRRRFRSRAAIMFALLVVAMLPAAASADYSAGVYSQGFLVCTSRLVHAVAPVMIPQASSQTMRFLDQLYRWNGKEWVLYDQGQWTERQGPSDVFSAALDEGLWTSGSTTWDGTWDFKVPPGYYGVKQTLHWDAVNSSYSSAGAMTHVTWASLDAYGDDTSCEA